MEVDGLNYKKSTKLNAMYKGDFKNLKLVCKVDDYELRERSDGVLISNDSYAQTKTAISTYGYVLELKNATSFTYTLHQPFYEEYAKANVD